MTDVNTINEVAFQIVAVAGAARSAYIESIRCARKGDFEAAMAATSGGDEAFAQGHEAHVSLIQCEAAGDPVAMNMMITHAEDQLMSAESIGVMAEELIETFKLLHEKHAL